MVWGVLQQIKSIHHSSFLYENSDFRTFYLATFSSPVCHQGAYRFGSPVLVAMLYVCSIVWLPFCSVTFDLERSHLLIVYACLHTCCSHFLTIIAGVDLHYRHESELPVCRNWGLNKGRRGARRGC